MAMSASNVPSKGERTRQAVLEAAIERFGEDGFRGTSVARIARDAGVGGTVPYAYFADKEALFLAALDEDAADVIHEGLSHILEEEVGIPDWQHLLITLVGSLEHHPLARRLLSGLEPDVTDRVVEIPALTELRKVCAERLRAEQLSGTVRRDIDPTVIASGVVSLVLSVLMSVQQIGPEAAVRYSGDVVAVFDAALRSPT